MSGTFNAFKRDSHGKLNPNNSIEKRNIYVQERGFSLRADVEEALAANNQKISERIQTQKNTKRTITNFQLPTLSGFDKTIETFPSHAALERPVDVELRLMGKVTSSPKSGTSAPKGNTPGGMRNSAIGLQLKKNHESSPVKSPYRDSHIETMPDRFQTSERRLIANMKLEQDRLLTQSRSSNKRNISYAQESLHRLPSSYSYDRGELLALHSLQTSVQNINGSGSPPLTANKSSIDKLKGHLTDVGSVGQPRAFTFMVPFSQEAVNPEFHRTGTTYSEERKTHSTIFNEHFIQSHDKNNGGHFSGFSFEKGFKVKKAFEVGTKKGAEIPRLWTSSSPRKESIPAPNASSPLRIGTATSGYRVAPSFTMRETGFSRKETKEDNGLVAELKKEVPNTFSGAPASRQDVLVLASWVDDKVKQFEKNIETEEEKYKKSEEVYNICLNELLRQVSVDCVERGELLYKIWMSYYKIFAQFKGNLDAEKEKNKQENQKEAQRLSDYYDELNKKRDDEVDKMKIEIGNLLVQKTESDEKLSKLMEKEEKHKEKIKKLVATLNQMQTEMRDLSNENAQFKKRFGKKQDFGTKVGLKNQVLVDHGSPTNKKGLYIPLAETQTPKNQTREVGFGGEDSDESKESSVDFMFEDIDHNEQIYRMKQLNKDSSDMILVDGSPKKRSNGCDAEAQTHLFLMNPKYDEVLEIQQIFDEIIDEYRMRQEFDGLFNALNLTEEEAMNANLLQEKIYDQVFSMSKKNSIDGLIFDMKALENSAKIESGPSGFKLSKFAPRSSQRMSARIMLHNLSPSETIDGEDKVAEAIRHLREQQSEMRRTSSDGSGLGLEIRGSTTDRNQEATDSKGANATSLGNLEDSVISREDEGKDTNRADENGQNHEEMGSSYPAGDQMQVIVEAPEEDCGSPSVYKRGKGQAGVASLDHSDVMSQYSEYSKHPDEGPKPKVSKLLSPNQVVDKLEQQDINEHAKLLLMTRLYRVQVDKNKELSGNVLEFHDQVLADKQNIVKLEDTIKDLKEQLAGLKKDAEEKCPQCSKRERRRSSGGNNTSGAQATPSLLLEDDGFDIDEDEEEEEQDSINGSATGKSHMKSLKRKGFQHKMTMAADPIKKRQKETKDFAANAIIEKIKNKKVSKFKNFMPMKAICKQVNNFYTERLNQAKENPALKDETLISFVYNWYTNAFGFKKLAEQKFIIFILSVKKYLYIVRINLFARFMNLLDGQSNFTTDEFNKYLEGLDFINNSHLGIAINNSETDSKHYTPFLRGLEYVKSFSENKMPVEEYMDFKKEFESLKETDPKNLNRNGIIDVDRLISKVLVKYRVICNRTKQFVVNAFKAADLDGNKYCSLKEFVMIYRNIESEKFDYDFVESMFYEHADVRIEGSVNLSFDKFTVVCVEYGLFSDLQQDQFLGINGKDELVSEMEKLQMNWPIENLEIKHKLESMGKVSEEEKKYWMDILDILQERITNFQNLDSTDFKPIMIAYKILTREVNDLCDKEVETDGYGVKKVVKTEHNL